MFANLQEILRGNRVSTWCELAEFEPWAYDQFLLLKNDLLSLSDIFQAISAAPSSRLGPSTSHLPLGPSASPGGRCAGTSCGAPVPLTHRVDTVCRKPMSLSPLSPGGPCGVDGGLWSPHGYSIPAVRPADMWGAHMPWTCWAAPGDSSLPPEASQPTVLGTPKEQALGGWGQQDNRTHCFC